MFIGAVELSQAITVDRRVTQIASSTADLVARLSPRIGRRQRHPPERDHRHHEGRRLHHGALRRKAAENRPAQRLVLAHQRDHDQAAWSCTYNGTGSTLSCACSNTTYSMPANLVTTLDSVVISEVTYNYKPLVFDYFMKSLGSSGGPAGTHLMRRRSTSSRGRRRSIFCRPTTRPAPRPHSPDRVAVGCRRRSVAAELWPAAAGTCALRLQTHRLPGRCLNRRLQLPNEANFHLCWWPDKIKRGMGTLPPGTPWDVGRRTRRSSCAS